ncbi:notch homolog 2 N-terminal-like protein C [Haliotis cracherodii]|uniref:notch homolog 2 N-terminal-like protein C n=1 Tax=Haliotis cracherodii TaxID=6455 RepID=UPI0039EC3A9A
MSAITLLGILLLGASRTAITLDTDCPVRNCLRCREGTCTVCKPGSQSCPTNCEERLVCAHGYCNGGCRDGWHGSRCNTRCPDGCPVCDKNTARCTRTDTPPLQNECPANCYCVQASCIRCRTGFTGYNCKLQDSHKADKPTSSYGVLTAVFTGVGLLLGVTLLTLCVTCYICRAQKRWRQPTVGVTHEERDAPPACTSSTLEESVELQERGDNAQNRRVFLPDYRVTALPPSYDSIFCEISRDREESRGACKPPSYETIQHV